MNLTKRFEDAMQFALAVHSSQLRKGTQVPYASHLLAVASIVLDYGGTEDEAIAALLHDSVEDRGVDPERIRRDFGNDVADIVVACSDSLEKDPSKKRPWGERKEKYLKHLENASPSALMVSAADKLHNARSISRDLRKVGDNVWMRFNASKDEILRYYDNLVKKLKARGEHVVLVDELSRAVAELHSLDGRPAKISESSSRPA